MGTPDESTSWLMNRACPFVAGFITSEGNTPLIIGRVYSPGVNIGGQATLSHTFTLPGKVIASSELEDPPHFSPRSNQRAKQVDELAEMEIPVDSIKGTKQNRQDLGRSTQLC